MLDEQLRLPTSAASPSFGSSSLEAFWAVVPPAPRLVCVCVERNPGHAAKTPRVGLIPGEPAELGRWQTIVNRNFARFPADKQTSPDPMVSLRGALKEKNHETLRAMLKSDHPIARAFDAHMKAIRLKPTKPGDDPDYDSYGKPPSQGDLGGGRNLNDVFCKLQWIVRHLKAFHDIPCPFHTKDFIGRADDWKPRTGGGLADDVEGMTPGSGVRAPMGPPPKPPSQHMMLKGGHLKYTRDAFGNALGPSLQATITQVEADFSHDLDLAAAAVALPVTAAVSMSTASNPTIDAAVPLALLKRTSLHQKSLPQAYHLIRPCLSPTSPVSSLLCQVLRRGVRGEREVQGGQVHRRES